MDTATHIAFGATWSGLALTADPLLAAQPERWPLYIAALVVGANAPDFDALARLRGRAAYVRHHRGAAHGLFAPLLWALAVVAPFAAAFGPESSLWHLFAWVTGAAAIHLALDALNGYGVQVLRPFSRRWVHLDVLPIWDPFLFFLHAATAVWWAGGGATPTALFPAVYGLTGAYILVRALCHRHWLRQLRRQFRPQGVSWAMPCLHWRKWSFVVEREREFWSGFIFRGSIHVVHVWKKDDSLFAHPLLRAAQATDGVRAFLAFAQRVHIAMVAEEDGGCTVRWRDIRFGFGRTLPFGVDVRFGRDGKVVSEKLGWAKKVWQGPYV